ncbi:MAG: hypothetical protein DWQ01_11245 [Planctomycetota bacterium]|nr:MAG: hypothetical protein DWQ01_11245 [Planctomycetota bacterium]
MESVPTRSPFHAFLFGLFATSILAGLSTPAAGQKAGELFEEVSEVLQEDYYDRNFRRNDLQTLVQKYRPQAQASRSLAEERSVIHEFLSHVPASHLALYSEATYETMLAELQGEARLTYGFQLVRLGEDFFVHTALEGGPAEQAGLLTGDRVVRLNGEAPENSPLLDWRSDDAWLPDPPIHDVLCPGQSFLYMLVERSPGLFLYIPVAPKWYSAVEATRASVQILETDRHRFGYVHFWFIHFSGLSKLLRELIAGDFAQCDALILDLRGRGGSAAEVYRILNVFDGRRDVWDKPMIALVDQFSRSAKEVLSYEIQQRQIGWLVGEPTAGAVIPATFRPVGRKAVLMFPSTTLGKHTKLLEGQGVQPEVEVRAARRFQQGADPILQAGIHSLLRHLKGNRHG